MGYKISGYLVDNEARIIILKESDWSIEANQVITIGDYEILNLTAGKKIILAIKSDGETRGYGNISPVQFGGDRGVFGGGSDGASNNVIDYITISTIGNAQSFGNLTRTTGYSTGGASNGYGERGVFGGGGTGSAGTDTNTIDYITINTLGNSQDFGDLTLARQYITATSNNNNSIGVFFGGGSTVTNRIDYVDIDTTGDATIFGNMSVSKRQLGSTSNGTNDRGVFAGGVTSTSTHYNVIEYVTITSISNSLDFGDLPYVIRDLGAVSNYTGDRGLFAGGTYYSYVNSINYITISSLGNSLDFGDISYLAGAMTGLSNGTENRGVLGGYYSSGLLNVIEYITISVLGNATDFGDLTVARVTAGAVSNA